ncbi:MAG: SDR family oxidoreductase [Lachnospiraceae bacterium]
MRIIVFGANGMAGHMVALYLQEQGHEVTGFVKRKNDMFPCIEGNAMDTKLVKEILAGGGGEYNYDIIINCIGILNKAVDAKLAEGIYINSVLPHLLEECVSGTKTRVIHISSDCVFSGNTGHYRENSHPDAESYYGRTKALGELGDGNNLTIRTSIVGPELKKDGIGLFHWFMSQTGFVNGFTEVIWSGVTTLELAKAIDSAMKQGLTGLYHLVNNTVISKYELLCLFNRYLNENRTVIHQNGSFINDKSLEDTRLELQHKIPSYEVMVQELAVWMQKHPWLYAQYLRS